MRKKNWFWVLGLIAILGIPSLAHADCTITGSNPGPRPEGTIIYNVDNDLHQICTATGWKRLGFGEAGSGGGGGGGLNGPGYFVITESTYYPNFGGLAGANAACLTELQNESWRGKTDAGTLTADRVKAWLCSRSTCNNLLPDTVYIFAQAGMLSGGGAAFITDSNGSGLGYAMDSTSWDGTQGFFPAYATNDEFWSNRADGTSEYWGTTPFSSAQDKSCNGWTLRGGDFDGHTGRVGNDGTEVWNAYPSFPGSCDSEYALMCIVHPEGTPAGTDDCEPPPSCSTIGQTCPDGSIFAGFNYYDSSTCKPFFVTDDNQGTNVMWKTTTGSNDISTDSRTDGQANHDNRSGTLTDFPAFDLCESNSYHGKNDWYLPSQAELRVLMQNRASLPNMSTGGEDYWSSTEDTTTDALNDYSGMFSSSSSKDSDNYVRCVRRD